MGALEGGGGGAALAAVAGLSVLWSNQGNAALVILISEGPTTKAKKEAGNFAFLLTGVAISDGISRVGVAGYLADDGIYTTKDGMVYGRGGSDSRNERVVLEMVPGPAF